jgi:hypothetical protein
MARSSRRRGRLLLLGAAVVAAGVFLKRDKVAGLLPSRTETYSPPASGPSNYDAPGPVANTATAVPVPYEPDPVDEAAEEAAAGAEAANIGGTVSDYAGPTGLPATEAERPLAEAGEGESEGQEQAEFDLERAAEPTAPGMSGAEHQIEDTIEQAANPLAGETLDPAAPPDEPPAADEPSAADAPTEPLTRDDEPQPEDAPARDEPDEAPVGEGEAAAGDERSEAGPVPRPDDPAPFEPPKTDEPGSDDDKDDGDDGGSDWRTWSGRSVNP